MAIAEIAEKQRGEKDRQGPERRMGEEMGSGEDQAGGSIGGAEPNPAPAPPTACAQGRLQAAAKDNLLKYRPEQDQAEKAPGLSQGPIQRGQG